jgi:hypothetical protein
LNLLLPTRGTQQRNRPLRADSSVAACIDPPTLVGTARIAWELERQTDLSVQLSYYFNVIFQRASVHFICRFHFIFLSEQGLRVRLPSPIPHCTQSAQHLYSTRQSRKPLACSGQPPFAAATQIPPRPAPPLLQPPALFHRKVHRRVTLTALSARKLRSLPRSQPLLAATTVPQRLGLGG